MSQNNDLKKLVEDVQAYGDLLLIANKGIGKTNSLMVLAREFRKLPNTRVFIFEDFPKWMLEFDKMPYMVIHDSDVEETSHTIDLEDTFLRHERDYTVKRGSEIQQALEENKSLIFTSEITDIERQAFFIYSIIQYFYRKAYVRKLRQYEKTEQIVFIIEESQNVFDSSTISKKIFNRLRKIFSVARNLDLHFVLCSQRLQDLNTKIRGRTRLLLGQVSIDDFELKIGNLLRHSQHRTDILTLEIGKFLYTANDSIVQFPKFQQIGKPYEYKPKPKPQPQVKKKNFLQKLSDFFSVKSRIQIPQETTETEFEKEDEEDLLDEDWLDIEDE